MGKCTLFTRGSICPNLTAEVLASRGIARVELVLVDVTGFQIDDGEGAGFASQQLPSIRLVDSDRAGSVQLPVL